jgi:hypothetical protein
MQKRKDVNYTFAQHFIAAQAGDLLHRAIPGYEPAVTIEREQTVDAGVEHSF